MSYSAKRLQKKERREGRESASSHRNEGKRNGAPVGDWFACIHCGLPVPTAAPGTEHRNHCPACLRSRHVDEEPGDRASECGSVMDPIAVWSRPGGDWAIIHRCRGCGTLHSNRIAGDDNEVALVALATRAIATPPFPLNRLATVASRE
ncbi:MAG: RNHCP domain-containing protein [Capsulimonadales bacterium]|nr:RNHCP domain-containing protein [Capsulimonadales bacterium]